MKIADLPDLKEIADMSMDFMSKTGYAGYSDRESIEQLISDMINAPDHEKIILIEPGVGFLAGISSKFIFGTGRIASEVAWWINEDKRGTGVGKELINAFEYWAKNVAGCTLISMTSIDEDVGKLYEKNGYKLYERAYMKVI